MLLHDIQKFIDPAIKWAHGKLNTTDYTFTCLAFVEDAYEKSNGIELFGGSSAQESADMYEAHNNKTEPPSGAFVFYQMSGEFEGEIKNWGHVGLCIGTHHIIHAWDKVRIDHYLEVQELEPAPGWTKPVFIGWSPVERVLMDYRINPDKKDG